MKISMMRRYRLLFFPLFLVLFSSGWFLYVNETANFHPITPGEAYRSAQLNRDELEYYIKKYNIKSILNLRGQDLNAQWYMEEIKVSAERNIPHYDITLSSSREPAEGDVIKLIEIFKSAPRPILIHCWAGADRSGLVAAMWKVAVDKEPMEEATKQLSVYFGHIPFGGRYEMDRFFQKWSSSYRY